MRSPMPHVTLLRRIKPSIARCRGTSPTPSPPNSANAGPFQPLRSASSTACLKRASPVWRQASASSARDCRAEGAW